MTVIDPILIEQIRSHYKSSCYAMKQQQRMDRALEAHIVFDVLGMPYGADKKVRDRFWADAKKLTSGANKATLKCPIDVAPLVSELVEANSTARKPYDEMRKKHEKAMKLLARKLPVWPMFKAVMPTGELSLARIVGEAGDISQYATVSKLWKRMGLAVMSGSRQGNPGKGASADDWIAHGYVPRRRSIMWVIGDSMMKNNKTYRPHYIAHKAYELARTDENKPMSAMHAHRRAQRKMEKDFLADLWSAWMGRAKHLMVTRDALPAPDYSVSQPMNRRSLLTGMLALMGLPLLAAAPRAREDGVVWLGEWRKRIDVRDYGAIGDGVADDRDAVRAAFKAAFACDGFVEFPPGAYRTHRETLIIGGQYRPDFPTLTHSSGYDGDRYRDGVFVGGDLQKKLARWNRSVQQYARTSRPVYMPRPQNLLNPRAKLGINSPFPNPMSGERSGARASRTAMMCDGQRH